MKDFVEIQYSVLWKLRFDQSYFWLVETIIEITGKQFSKKELILASGQVIFWLVKINFFLSIFRRPVQVFFRLVKNYFSRKSLLLVSENGV